MMQKCMLGLCFLLMGIRAHMWCVCIAIAIEVEELQHVVVVVPVVAIIK